VLTNNGPFHCQLEQALAEYLGVEHLSLLANGTIALVVALQALGIKGEMITTPYTFVATAHSLLWNNVTPVFVDIQSDSCNLDPLKIEEAITPRTTGILAVHCYGNPCQVESIEEIADRHGLRVIYDAAHAFGVQYQGESLLKHGDLSVLSFHATKVFNTFEGGAIICPDTETKQTVDYLKNFGFADEVTVTTPGINGKMSEFNAAYGLLQLKYVDGYLARRRAIAAVYRSALEKIPGISLLPELKGTIGNASYFPVLVNENYPMERDELYKKLKRTGIHARRYFYPLVSNMPAYNSMPSASLENLPIAEIVANQVICLPIYPDLTETQLQHIISLIR